jgi:hypothetical protein
LDKDEVWAIFDGDEHIDKDIQNWKRALVLAAKETINLGISNPRGCKKFCVIQVL